MQDFDRIEAVVFHCLHDVFRQTTDLSGGAERAIVHMAPGAARDLTDLWRAKPTRLPPVKLAGFCEGDVIDVHVQTHANGIGGNQIVNFAGLVHLNLLVAGSRAQRTQHHRAATPHALQ